MYLRLFYIAVILALATSCSKTALTLPEAELYQLDISNSQTIKSTHVLLKPLSTMPLIYQGLMHQNSLNDYTGVILIFPRETTNGIWMKNMKMPIDALFFDNSGKLVATHKSLQPCQEALNCRIYKSKNTRYIIETYAGFINDNGITKTNTTLRLDIN